MYFYRIEVYHSFTEPTYMIMSHKYYFDKHQLNIIVQEAFDECIEKYSNKLSYDKGEEPCRMAVETIFEEYLPAQLQNHGFTNIKINETCSIMDGELFLDYGAINPVLKKRYLDKVLPPCKKCMRDECIVPNIRKDNSLPITHLNEKEKNSNSIENNSNNDMFNISLLKLYFTNSHKSRTEAIKASEIIDNILENNKFKDYWTEWGETIIGKHKGDIICGFDLDTDMKRGKKLLEDYGFVLEDTKDGFWITGVKE